MRTAGLLSLALLLGVFVAQHNVRAIDVDTTDYDLVEGESLSTIEAWCGCRVFQVNVAPPKLSTDDEPDPESEDEPIPAEVGCPWQT